MALPLSPRADRSRARARQLEKRRSTESLAIARVHAETLTDVEVDPDAWVEPIESMDAAAVAAEAVVDVVAKAVPAAGDGEDDRRAQGQHVASDDEGILSVHADGQRRRAGRL